MGLFMLFKLGVYMAVMVAGGLGSTESAIYVHFDQTPPPLSRFSSAVFRYSVKRPDVSNACRNSECSFHCELDGHTLRPCPAGIIMLKNLTVNHEHHFLLNVTSGSGETNSSAYSWFIDTILPTATLSSEQNYTNAEKVTVEITFSEACTGQGGFKCLNSSNCDVVVHGPGRIHAPSLRVITPNIKYEIDVYLFSVKSMYGRIVIRMVDNFCTDLAGNHFTSTNVSTLIIRFDRRLMQVDLWTSVPSYKLGINGVSRTVFATNRIGELKVFMDFSIPVVNSTEQILDALHTNVGNLLPIHGRNHGNRWFVFQLKNISTTEIITVELQASKIIGRTGSPLSSVASLTFLYDSTKPVVGLSTSSPSVTRESNINIIVEFTKPVFGFQAYMVEVHGGRLIRFEELSRALYSLSVLAIAQKVVSVSVPAGKVNDISGNPNLASNVLEVKHYLTPSISMALHSFVTGGILASSLAAAALSLSTANLEALSKPNHQGANIVASEPSTNLHGMVGHLQVFVLSDWLFANPPIEYSETTKGLRWLIPRLKLPWKRSSTSIWPSHFYLVEEKLTKRFSSLSITIPSNREEYSHADLNLTRPSSLQHELPFLTEIVRKCSWLHEQENISMKNAHGLPLDSNEYLTHFLRGEPLSASNVVKKMENYKGWEDLEMNLFWLGIGGSSLLAIHLIILLFLRWRTGRPHHGILSVHRFELLLLILMLPCISQASAFVIRGGTTWGIITGAFLLAIPVAFVLSVWLFLIFAIFSSSLAQYKEIRYLDAAEPCYRKLWYFVIGRAATGKWFYKEGLPSSFLQLWAILFENQKGPPVLVFVNQNDLNSMPRWTESGQTGIGRMRALSSDDSIEEIKIPISRRIMGCARSSYIILDLTRRVSLGIISGAYSSHQTSQSLFAFTITLIQFMYLLILMPHIRRRVHLVESISLLCEVGIFGLSICMDCSKVLRTKTLGYLMLALLFLTFVVQITTEWYALIKCLLKLSQPKKYSFRHGLKLAAKGLVLPLLPKMYWTRVVPCSLQLKTGLAPVLPRCLESDWEMTDTRAPRTLSLNATPATVVPVLSPGSPRLDVIQSNQSVICRESHRKDNHGSQTGEMK